MSKLEAAQHRFLETIKLINSEEQSPAYRKAYAMPFMFYLEHEPEEAARILLEENPA